MVAPPAGLFPTRAPASGKQQHRTILPETEILDVSHDTPVLPMSCSEEDRSSSSSLGSNPGTSPTAKTSSTFPTQSESSSLSDDAISLKTASSLKSGGLGPSQTQSRKSSSQLPLPQSRSPGYCILSRFPEDWPPRPRTPLCATQEAGCSKPPGSSKSSSSQLSRLPAPGPLCLGVGERQPRDKEESLEEQLSSMEARLKAVQEQQTLWLQELVPAVRRVRSELANIGKSLGRLVQMFEAQVPTCPHFHATQEKAKAEGSRAGGKRLFHPTFTRHPCQEI